MHITVATPIVCMGSIYSTGTVASCIKVTKGTQKILKNHTGRHSKETDFMYEKNDALGSLLTFVSGRNIGNLSGTP